MKPLCNIKSALRQIYKFEGTLSKEFGLTLNETLIMCSLLATDTMNVGDLAEELGLSLSRTSRVVKKMEEKGLVLRSFDKDDHRKMIFSLTNEGTDIVIAIQSAGFQVPYILISPVEVKS